MLLREFCYVTCSHSREEMFIMFVRCWTGACRYLRIYSNRICVIAHPRADGVELETFYALTKLGCAFKDTGLPPRKSYYSPFKRAYMRPEHERLLLDVLWINYGAHAMMLQHALEQIHLADLFTLCALWLC